MNYYPSTDSVILSKSIQNFKCLTEQRAVIVIFMDIISSGMSIKKTNLDYKRRKNGPQDPKR